MKLPVMLPELKGQRYDCERCGRGCRELVVHLTERDRKKIDRQDWGGKLRHAPYVPFKCSFVLNHTPDGACVFLREDGLCAIHAEFGFSEKPLACQLYPFTLEPDGEVLRVSVRFDCPAIAKSSGDALAKHKQDVVRIAQDFKAAAPKALAASSQPAALTAGRDLSREELDALIEHLDGWVRGTDRPIMDRLIGLDDFVETLAAARLGAVRGERFVELVGLMAADLPNVVASFDPAALPPPSARQLKLFRQVVFSHCENVRLRDARAPLLKRLANRMDQLKRARQLASGTGSVPPLVRGRGEVSFRRVQAIGPHPDVSDQGGDALLTRYLRARIVGRTAFGAGYFGWPALDGLRALLVAVAVTGWLARYVAGENGRATLTHEDLVTAIGIVDRNAARSPELGVRSSGLRLQYLARDRGIRRLLCAYPPC